MAQYIYHIPFFPVFQKMSLSMVGKEHKNLWPGEGYISGTVIAAGAPMPDAVIELYDCSTKQYVKSTTTDLLGDYRFDNLDRNRYFDVIATDPSTLWEKKVSSYRRPKFDFNPEPELYDGAWVDCVLEIDPSGDTLWATNTIAVMDIDALTSQTSYTDGKGIAVTCSGGAVTVSGITGIDGTCIDLNNSAGAAVFTLPSDILAGGDFCVESWFRIGSTLPSGSYGFGLIGSNDNSLTGWQLRIQGTSAEWVYPNLGAAPVSFTWAVNTTYHVAAYRIGTQHYIAVNGVVSAVSLSDRTATDTNAVKLGSQTYGGGSDIEMTYRITSGNSRYGASNFTPTQFINY